MPKSTVGDIRSPGHNAWVWVRKQVFATWRGPKWVTVIDASDSTLYGSRLLSLDLRHEPEDFHIRLESRTIYDAENVDDETPDFVLLRAVSWDEVQAKEAIRANPLYHGVTMPARFVLVPRSILQSWITRIGAITTSLPVGRSVDDRTALNRQLRLESDYIASVAELIWTVDDSAGAKQLNETWLGIWAEMEDLLSSSPKPSEVYEEFDRQCDLPQIKYALERNDAVTG